MKKLPPEPFLLLVGLLLILMGMACEKSKKARDGPPPTVAVPVETPPADSKPIKDSVGKAYASAVLAKDGLDKALSKPVGPETPGEVSTARNNVGTTVAELSTAKDTIIPKLEMDLAAETANRHAADAALRKNNESYVKTLGERDEVIKERDDEIAKLKDEELRWIRWALGAASVFFFVAGIACAVAGSMYGMVSGWKIAAIAWPCGAACGMLAVYMKEILLASLYVSIGAGLLLLAWCAWRFFHHDPAITQAHITRRRAEKMLKGSTVIPPGH